MKSRTKNWKKIAARTAAAASLAITASSGIAGTLNLSQTPLFLTSTVLPNILVIYDNSESMDAYMNGQLVEGSDSNTRGNIGRQVMRDTLNTYQNNFRWGLMTYRMDSNPPTLYNTWVYYMGDDAGMVFTDNCTPASGQTVITGRIPGVSTDGGGKCVPNPEPFTGGNYITYNLSSDDPTILDVLYASLTSTEWYYAYYVSGGTNYSFYKHHSATTSWAPSTFSSCWAYGCPATLTATDAGFLPSNPATAPATVNVTRQIYLPRAWGYNSAISGASNGTGKLNEDIANYSSTHQTKMLDLLQPETNSSTPATGHTTLEIKNGAVYTPLAGTLATAYHYFSGTSYNDISYTSPITSGSCQQNYVVMVTDGLPTGIPLYDSTFNFHYTSTTDAGTLYPTADRYPIIHTGSDSSTGWNTAVQDTINAVKALRTTPYSSKNYDITTYVVALSDTVANADALSVMNAMADVGGTGTAYLATDQAALQDAIDSITSSIASQIASASSVATNTTALNTNSTIYQASFESSDWHGDLKAYAIGSTDGTVSSTPSWEAGANSWITGTTTSTQTPSQRHIFTYKPSSAIGIPFEWPVDSANPTTTELDGTQITALNKNASGVTDNAGANRLSYLRGDGSNESCATCVAPYPFRTRPASKLGDIANSTPVYVGTPDGGYPTSLESVSYTSFRDTYYNRTQMIYAGANDGMLHGFNATTGQELLGYVPNKVFSNLSKLTDPSYSHRYYVDGSATVADVFYDSAWHTVLVGTLGGGGQGVFALDITNPANFTETTAHAQSTVLWEFTDSDNTATTTYTDGDPNLGYTYGQAAVGKVCTTRDNQGICTASKWAAIFGNGYNNTESDGSASTTGDAMLYIVDIQTGNLIKAIDTLSGTFTPRYCPPTTAGSCTSIPNGLGSPAAVDVNGDYIIDYVYAGDLAGNMWKFDLSTSSSDWGSAYKTGNTPAPLYIAKDPTGYTQPITTRPDVTLHPTSSGYLVFFGTGKYLETTIDSQTSNAQTQTFYSIWDNAATVTSVNRTSNPNLLQQWIIGETSDGYRVTTANSINWTNYKGWFMDLCNGTSATSATCSGSNKGEKQVSFPLLINSRIIFTTLIPDTGASCYGGYSWLMELNYSDGSRVSTSPFDTNNDGVFSTGDYQTAGGVTAAASGARLGGASGTGIANTPALIFGGTGSGSSSGSGGSSGGGYKGMSYKYNTLSTGELVKTNNNLGPGMGRVSWRELINQ